MSMTEVKKSKLIFLMLKLTSVHKLYFPHQLGLWIQLT